MKSCPHPSFSKRLHGDDACKTQGCGTSAASAPVPGAHCPDAGGSGAGQCLSLTARHRRPKTPSGPGVGTFPNHPGGWDGPGASSSSFWGPTGVCLLGSHGWQVGGRQMWTHGTLEEGPSGWEKQGLASRASGQDPRDTELTTRRRTCKERGPEQDTLRGRVALSRPRWNALPAPLPGPGGGQGHRPRRPGP